MACAIAIGVLRPCRRLSNCLAPPARRPAARSMNPEDPDDDRRHKPCDLGCPRSGQDGDVSMRGTRGRGGLRQPGPQLLHFAGKILRARRRVDRRSRCPRKRCRSSSNGCARWAWRSSRPGPGWKARVPRCTSTISTIICSNCTREAWKSDWRAIGSRADSEMADRQGKALQEVEIGTAQGEVGMLWIAQTHHLFVVAVR